MRTRRIVTVLVLVGLLFVAFSSAQAVCTVSGKVTTVGVNYTSGYVTVYIQPFSTLIPGMMWYGYIQNVYQNDQLVGLFQTALGSGISIQAEGNISSCPTSGTSRYIGYITRGYAFKNY